MNPDTLPIPNRRKKNAKWFLNLFFVIAFLIIGGNYLLAAPHNNKDVTIHIVPNQSFTLIASELEARNVIRHAEVFKILMKILNFDKRIAPGDYYFAKNKSALAVAWQLAQNQHRVEPIKITFKEGMTNNEMADLLAQKLTLFRRDLFLSHDMGKQGYLFPDTYFLFPLSTTDEIISQLSSNFNQQIKKVATDLSKSDKTKEEIIIMASLIEREAKGESDASIISGILWKRISIGMPLQVDVDRTTYDTKGLPLGPINNPGLTSIKAALNPVSSPYLYYLHDKSGQVHYAKNFEEHKLNISKYLK